MKKQPEKKPENAPDNIEWLWAFGMWGALINTNEQGEETWHYWNKHGYLYAEIVYNKDDRPIKTTYFPPEGIQKNAVYVVPADKWIDPDNQMEIKQGEETLKEKLKEKVAELTYIKDELNDENSELNSMMSVLKQVGDIAKEVNEEAKIPKTDFESFRKTLLYGFEDLFLDFAGGKMLGVEDHEVSNSIYPESGDWVFYDKRCQAGTFGVSHDDFSFKKVTIKNPEQHGVDYSLPKIKRVVSTKELNKRYIWLAFFFCNWEHREFETPFDYEWDKKAETFEQNVAGLNRTFNREIKKLKDDSYLAMYWLLHMGICCDDRYEQVKEQVIKHKLNEVAVNGDDYMRENIRECLAFFDELGDYQNLSLDSKYHKVKNKDLFLIRRANAIYNTQSSASYQGFEKAWLSVALYPKGDECSVQRINRLTKNLAEHNDWDKFEEKLQSEKIDVKNPPILLLNYVIASNPNTEDKSHFANSFLEELQENKKLWDTNNTRDWVGTMLYNLKGLYTQIQLLQEMMEFYFRNDFDGQEYKELFEYYFANNTEAQVKDLLSKMQQLRNKIITTNELTTKDKLDYAKKIIEFQDDDVIFSTMKQCVFDNARAYIFVALLELNRSDKENLLIKTM